MDLLVQRVSLFNKPLSVVLIISLIVSAFISFGSTPVYGATTEGELNNITRQKGVDPLDSEDTSTDTGSGNVSDLEEERPPLEKNVAVVRLDISPNTTTIGINTSQTYRITGFDADGKEVEVPQDQVIWNIKSDSVPGIGTLVNGTLTAGDQPGTGVIIAEYNGVTTEVTVTVEAPMRLTAANNEWDKVFEDFEDISDLRVTSVASISAVLGQSERPAPVKYGLKAGKLDYDFTGMGGTSAAYIRFKSPDGKDGREISGNPKKIGFWVYGEDKKHWIRGQIQDQKGTTATLDFTGSSEILNGWRYVTADIPSNNYPIKLNYIYLVETGTKSAGTIYVDQVSVIYEDTDIFALEWSGVRPLGIGESVQANVLITRKGYSEPQPADSSITFSSSNEGVAKVNSSGTITASAAGETDLTATYQNKYSTVYKMIVSQQSAEPSQIQIEGPPSLVLTETANLKSFAVFGDGEPVDVSADTIFTIDQGSAVAEITGQQIRAKAVGEVKVTAKYKGHESSYTVQVKAGELKSIEIGDVFSAIVGKSPVKAKVYGDYKVEGKKEIVSGIVFVSANPNIAAIDSETGQITAIAPGTTLITADVAGKRAQQLLVVTNPAAHPKRELRGAWISTVENIDWPTKNVFDPEQQRQDFTHLLDELKQTGINAVFVQVRPTSDSFFPSKYFPWSHWLTGKQGEAPSDGYDPLKFMIEEAHKRNLEFHAWINPYRISMHDDPSQLAADHPARVHPDWVIKNGGKMYFNPGIPEAKNYIIDGVKEIVEKYDVDGIHMDDYFYPYPGNEPFNDSKEYDVYKKDGGTMSLDDWRRANVDSIVEGLNVGIKQIKPYVKFGISPFGIWRNKSSDPTGSDTNGQQNYDGLYADTRTWMKEGWVDYLAPQVYWHFGYSAAAYEKLIDWWTKEINGENDGSGEHHIQLYIGQGAYRVGEDNWKNPDQLPAQLRFNNDHGDQVSGNILFSTSHVLANPLGVRESIASMYSRPALIPAMSWLPDSVPSAPVLTALKGDGGSVRISWKDNGDKEPTYYAIYRAQGKQAPDVSDTSQLLATLRRTEGQTQIYTDPSSSLGQEYTYAVTAVSRLHHESEVSNTLSGRAEIADYTKIELGELKTMTVSQTQQVKVLGILGSGEKKEITEGITFTSSESKSASISTSGLITALAEGTTVVTAEVQGKSASYTLNVQAQMTTNPGTEIPSPSPGASTPVTTPAPAPTPILSSVWVISERDLDNIKDGKLDIQVNSGKTQVQLPSSALAKLGKDGMLNIHFAGTALSIPASVLKEAVNLVPSTNVNDLQVIVEVKPLTLNLVTDMLKLLQQNSDATLTAKNIVNLGIFVKAKDGKLTGMERFTEQVLLSFDLPDGAKASRVGIYRITGNGQMDYVGGNLKTTNQITAKVTTPGQYSAIAYDISFKDIDSSHWASEVIKDMAARHVLKGLPDGSFSPKKPISRAEFASMLTRLLNLPASDGAGFTDVRISDWYAKEITAAVQAGIIRGSGDGLFHPNQAVSREEMAIMLLNTYVAAGGQKPSSNPQSLTFEDKASISSWAHQSINDAVSLGLLQGSGNKFNPAQGATRAESSQAMANLLKIIEKL